MNKASEFETEQLKQPQPRQSLWHLTTGPLIWSLHFLLCYITAAVWCAKVAGRTGSLDGARIAVGVYTLLAVIGIALALWRGYKDARFGGGSAPHDVDSAADRRRFLGLATVLLCALSLVATVYVALPALFIVSCR